MINNYYSIPSIPCSERENIVASQGEFNEKCQGLNPDSIYQTLYPSYGDPLVNYNTQESMTSNVPSYKNIQSDAKGCASNCDADNSCSGFKIQKPSNICILYKDTDMTRQQINTSNYNVEMYRKNDLLEENNNCNINDNFIQQPENFYPQQWQTIKYMNEPEISQKECLSSCAYDNNCNSVLYASANQVCNMYNTDNLNPAPQQGSKLYTKKGSKIGNRFGAPNSLTDYYKDYPTVGKEGDYFCEYIDAKKKCEISYVVGKDGMQSIPSSVKPKKYVPPKKVCLPPDCVPELPYDGKIGKLRINGNIEIKCDPGDKECEKKINNYYQDQLGFPTSNGSPDPNNGYPIYTKYFNQYKNLEISINEMDSKPEITAFDFPEHCEQWCKENMDCGAYSYVYGNDGRAQCKYYDNRGVPELRNSLKAKDGTTSFIKQGDIIDKKPKTNLYNTPYFNNFDAEDTGVKKVKVCLPDDDFSPNGQPVVGNGINTTSGNQMSNEDKAMAQQRGERIGEENADLASSDTMGKTVKGVRNKRNSRIIETFADAKFDDSFFQDPYIESTDLNINLPKVPDPEPAPSFGLCPDSKTPKKDANGSNCPTVIYKKDDNANKTFNSCPSYWDAPDCPYGTEKCESFPKYCWDKTNNHMITTFFSPFNNKCSATGEGDGSHEYKVNGVNVWRYPFSSGKWDCGSGWKDIPKKENIANCGDTEYGCCPDGDTPKIDSSGTNCITIKKEDCIKSKYGCCPGTNIPKKYLCRCETKSEKKLVDECDIDFCKDGKNKDITNCELNSRQVGDPYQTGTAQGKKCKNQGDCDPGNMCNDGFCSPINRKFYNSINSVQNGWNNSKSGSSFNAYLCGKNDHGEENEKCSTNYEPVCGADGRTYQNDCKARNSGIKIQHYGSCDDVIETFIVNQGNVPRKGFFRNYFSTIIFILAILFFVIYLSRKMI